MNKRKCLLIISIVEMVALVLSLVLTTLSICDVIKEAWVFAVIMGLMIVVLLSHITIDILKCKMNKNKAIEEKQNIEK